MELDVDTAFAELGLTSAATEREIKAAWRRMVSQWHPDRNPSSAAVAKMQRINRAVDAIRRAGLRRPDSAGDAGAAPDPTSAAPSAEQDAPPDEPQSPPQPQPEPAQARAQAAPRPLQRRVRLTLEEAAFGCIKVMQGKLTEPCAVCEGAGQHLQAAPCPACNGAGAVRERGWFGWAGPDSPCTACAGQGAVHLSCIGCGGAGKAAPRRYRLSVRLPAGVRTGDSLSVAQRPEQTGAPPGPVTLRIEVEPHALLSLDNDGTVRCSLPVDGFAWIAHRPIEVPTLDGPKRLQLHHGQLSHRLKGLGFPVERRGARGDQVVTVTPVFPQPLSTAHQTLLDQLIASTSGPGAQAPDPQLQNWNQAMQDWKRRRPG